MDTVSRYSVGSVVPDTTISSAIVSFDSQWILPFGPPGKVFYDPAFKTVELKKYLSGYGIDTKSLHLRRRNKNVIESNHRIIRDIYLRLKHSNSTMDILNPSLLVQQSLYISNELNGNNLMSAHELAKGYTRPLVSSTSLDTIPEDIVHAQKALHVRHKLSLILRSKSLA
ncbi:unnamed protein product [Agarophyton chilense]